MHDDSAPLPPDFSFVEKLSSGSQSRLLRVQSQENSTDFALIKLPGQYARDWNNWATRDSEFSRWLEGDVVLPARAMRQHEDRLLPVFENFAGGLSLESLIRPRGLRLRSFLRLALRLCAALGRVHKNEIIHNDLQPASFLVNVKSGQIRITGFGRAQLASVHEGGNPTRIWSSMRYLSPERSGRINRPVDFRSDYYSLTAILYELLCGVPPFDLEDPLELLHAHIALHPQAPHEIRSDIPRVLSAILMRNLAKSPDDRYRSLSGLQADLRECLRQLRETNAVVDFVPGVFDAADRYVAPRRLYGRETELAALTADFERSSTGTVVLSLIEGHSGIGKSALVHELSVTVFRERGSFIEGKFDQLQRDTPYHAIVQALRAFVRSLLSSDDAELQSWQRRLSTALEHSGTLLCPLIPELELLLEPQAAPPEFSPVETHNRFYQAFLDFIEAVATPERPLVLFLDDLQWADPSSFEIILRLSSRAKTGVALQIIGAYRGDELPEGHPIRMSIERIASGSLTRTIALRPLEQASVNQFVAEALQTPEEHTRSLAGTVTLFSGGNPFLAGEFLKGLIERGRLRFDHERRLWDWDERSVDALRLGENAVDFLAERVERLPGASRTLLSVAACYGNRFRMAILRLACPGESEAEIQSHMETAARAGLVLLMREATDAPARSHTEFSYRFAHDRVQELIYERIPSGERGALHLRLGQGLRDAASATRAGLDSEQIFEIAHHLNLANDLLDSNEEPLELARINLRAGRRALASAAAETAQRLLQTGLDLLPANAWQELYALRLALTEELARAFQLGGEAERSEALVDEIMRESRATLDRVAACEIRIHTRNNQNRHEDALSAARQLLKELGVRLPRKATASRLARTLLHTKLQVALRGGTGAILRAGSIRNAEKQAAIRILTQIGSTAYQSDPDLFAIVVLLTTRLSYRYGIAPNTPYALALYAVAHSGVLADVRQGQAILQHALALVDREEHAAQRARVLIMRGAFIEHWTESLQNTLPHLEEGARAARINGDTEFRGYALFFRTLNQFFSSGRLDTLLREMRGSLAELRRQRSAQSVYVQAIWLQTVRNLSQPVHADEAALAEELEGEDFSETITLPELSQRGYQTAIAWVHQARALLAFLNGRPQTALTESESAFRLIKSTNGSAAVVPLHYIAALSHLALCDRSPQGRSYLRKHRRDIRRLRKQLRRRGEEAPDNQLHRYYLVEAEWQRAHGKEHQALHYYELAVQEAGRVDFVFDEALAAELAARFCLGRRHRAFARSYAEIARKAYRTWGCPRKVEQLEIALGADVLPDPARVESRYAQDRPYSQKNQLPASNGSQHESLDMRTVIKAVETISGEIHLETLLARLIRIVMEHSGARRGALIVAEADKKLRVVARLDLNAGDSDAPPTPTTEAGEDLSTVSDLPLGVIQFVARTREAYNHDAASGFNLFQADPYWQAHSPRSVLCVPIMHQNQLYGVFYLEHELIAGVFDRTRMEVLEFLNTHVAVSLRNARLYREQQDLTRAFARFLPNQFMEFLEKPDVRTLELGDSVQEDMIVLFSDIRGFTALSETMNAHDNFRFMNSYFKRMEPAILRNQGFVDKFIGDAIMALFAYSAKNAILAAMEMRFELNAFNRHRRKSGLAPIDTGIGLHAGEVMIGTVGSSNRMETTVIGDSVNLASRVEGLTKLYGVSILLSDELAERIDNREAMQLREIDTVRVRGRQRPVTLYEAWGADSLQCQEQKHDNAALFTVALALYRAGKFEDAGRAFADYARRAPLDAVAPVLGRRCESMAAQAPEDWAGVLQI